MWPETEICKRENKRELNLFGASISSKIDKDGLDEAIFGLEALNLLHVSETNLEKIPDLISNLKNLEQLMLYSNKISLITNSVGSLEKLKLLDLSRNQITVFPMELCNLANLTTINLANNNLESFPNLPKASKLSVINLSNNKLTSFPDICHAGLSNLSEIYLKSNQITSIPDDIIDLISLKTLNLACNAIKTVPKVVALITKLKEIDLSENPIADKRLLKLIQQCRTKQIVDYVKQHGTTSQKSSELKDKGNLSKIQKEKSLKKTEIVAKHKISIQRHTEETMQVILMEEVKNIRPNVLCCIIRDVELDAVNFKKFLQIQTKLHDTVCEKREASTIATHDLSKIKGKHVTYSAMPPKKIKIQQLGKVGKISGEKLFDNLKNEADAIRREKKRNVYTGIHKYLYLLENKDTFPYLEDAEGNIISLPPLTNSEITKISTETKNIFIEVTGATAPACKKAIEGLIQEMLLNGIGTKEMEDGGIEIFVQQVKITDLDGNLKGVFPSKMDLSFGESILVERE